MIRCYLLIIALVNCVLLYSQPFRQSITMPYLNIGSYSNKPANVFSFTTNQASLAEMDSAMLGIYSERRFMLIENSRYSLAAALPTTKGNFGFQLNYAGYKNFREYKVGLAYGRKLGSKTDVGVQFNYYGYGIPLYDRASTLNFEGGAVFYFLPNLKGGFHIYNPVSIVSMKTGERLASAYKMGFGYDPSGNFYVGLEIVKEEDKSVNVVAGFEYRFEEKFFLRAGISSGTSTFFAGSGLLLKDWRVDVSASFHPQLGISPGLLLMTKL